MHSGACGKGGTVDNVNVDIPASATVAGSMMDIFVHHNFKLNKMFLSVLGLWPYQSRRRRYGLVTFWVIVVWSQFLAEIFAIIELSDDPEIVNLSITAFMTDLACVTKFLNIMFNFDKMFQLAERMKIDWKSLADDPEISILRDYGKISRQFTIAYAIGMYGCLILFMGQPAIPKILQSFGIINSSEPAKLPFPLYWYGVDMEAYYYHMFIHGSLVTGVVITVIVAADTMFLVYVQHACSMFTVVGHQLKRMADEVKGADVRNLRPQDDIAFRYVVNCIKKHKEAIELGDLIESSYTWVFFSFLGFNTLMMSFTGYQMVIKLDENPKEALRFGIFTMAEILHLFFQTFFSERLKEHSEQLRQLVYQAEWHRTSIRTQKLLGLVILRTYVPCQLTAGKIVAMSLENFTSTPASNEVVRLSIMDIFEHRNFKLNKMLLATLGLWPYQSRRRRYGLVTFWVIVVWTQLLSEVFAIIELSDDPEIVFLSVTAFITDLACITKFLNIMFNFNKMYKLAERMRMDWESVGDDPEKSILHDYGKMSRQFTIAYAFGMYGCLVLFMGQPAAPKILQSLGIINASGPAKLPFPLYWYGVDMETHYYYMFIHGSLVTGVVITVIVAADTMFLVYVQHACSMFTVVGYQLRRINAVVRQEATIHTNLKSDAAFQHVVRCAKKHKEIIAFGDLIESSYTWAFFSIVGFNMITMSFTGYQMVAKLDENPKEALRFGVFTVAEILHLFFQSYFSERLKDHSATFHQHVYQAEWYNESVDTQKLFGVMIMRTLVPCKLTAGRIMTMSLENFTSILKTSMSYFTLLRSMQ